MIRYVILAFLATCFLSGCGEKETRDDPAQAPSRIQDPEYVKKLDEMKKERNRLMTEMAKAAREYEVAKAEDPTMKSERFIAAEKRREEISREALAAQGRARRAVQTRIHEEFKQTEQTQKKGNN